MSAMTSSSMSSEELDAVAKLSVLCVSAVSLSSVSLLLVVAVASPSLVSFSEFSFAASAADSVICSFKLMMPCAVAAEFTDGWSVAVAVEACS